MRSSRVRFESPRHFVAVRGRRFRCSLSVLVLSVKPRLGGAWGWLVRVGCARTPSLISVRDPGWLRVGDMMGDGVFRDAVRPLGL